MKYYKTNQFIPAGDVRVIGPDDKQLGIMNRDEALFRTKQQGLDLVMVAEKARPPVVKMIQFSKFKYQQQQKIKEGQKNDKTRDQKEIRFTPFIGQKDFDTRIARIKEFLSAGHKIKITVKFTGRQITRKDFGDAVLKRAVAALADYGTQETAPKLQGKLMWVTISPKKNIIKK
jgi:translation initiation factor IF-3